MCGRRPGRTLLVVKPTKRKGIRTTLPLILLSVSGGNMADLDEFRGRRQDSAEKPGPKDAHFGSPRRPLASV